MCVHAAELYEPCLIEWGLDWPAAGYDDRAHFLGSCDTWSWEMAQVHRDALRRGLTEERDWLVNTCDARSAAFSAPEATCDDYTSVDWDSVPWSVTGD
jgi:hypothetical protein